MAGASEGLHDAPPANADAEIQQLHPLTQAIAYSMQEAPREACGLLSTRRGRWATCYPIKNVAANPEGLYLMDMAQQLAAMAAIDAAEETLAVIWHSHPCSPPRPSTIDVSLANYPQLVYAIIGLAGAEPEVRWWKIIDGKVTLAPRPAASLGLDE